MGLAWILLLEVCKFVGRKHRRLIYIRAIGPLLVRLGSAPCSMTSHRCIASSCPAQNGMMPLDSTEHWVMQTLLLCSGLNDVHGYVCCR